MNNILSKHRGRNHLFAQKDQEKFHENSNIELGLERQIEFGQMSPGVGVHKFLVGGISKGMGFENPQDLSVVPRDVTEEVDEARCE